MNLARAAIERQVAGRQDIVRGDLMTPQDRVHLRDQLGELKRFRQVIVRAGIQPLYAILDRVSRGEHDDWHVATGAEGAAEGPSRRSPVA